MFMALGRINHLKAVLWVFLLSGALFSYIPAEAGLTTGGDLTNVVVCSSSYTSQVSTSGGGLAISPDRCQPSIPSGYRVTDSGVPYVIDGYTHTRYSIARIDDVVDDAEVVTPNPAPTVGETDSLVPLGRDGDYNPDGYGSCEFVQTVNNVIQFLIKMSALLAVIVFLYAGFIMVSSRGDSALIEGAKKLFANVLIGFVILLTAFLIINTIIGILVGGASGGLTWQTIECQYANESAPAAEIAINNVTHTGLSIAQVDAIVSTYDPTLLAASAGVCTDGKIAEIWGPLASSANCIITEESACGALPISRSDIGADGNPFSFGVMQINTTVHEVKGCGHLNIPDMRCLDAWSGKDYKATVSNTSLFNACRNALLNPECNMINGKRIYREAGNRWRPWSTAQQCGLR